MTIIYKIVPKELWRANASFEGSPIDLSDGYIHLSTSKQVAETAKRHFRGIQGLLLLDVEVERLGAALRWEPSRGGDLFPHLYASLEPQAVVRVRDLPLGPDGVPMIPEDVVA